MVKIKDLCFTYGSKIIFDKLSFSISAGEIIGIWGTNGIGKTTLIELISGIKQPIEKQQITFSKKLIGKIGFVSQHPLDLLLPWKKVLQNVLLSLKLPDCKSAFDQLEKYRIESVFHDKFVKDLSGGYQQRLAWACTLSDKNNLIFLDEPFSKQDFNISNYLTKMLKEYIRNKDKSVLLISHDPMKLIQCCNRILILSEFISDKVDQIEDISLNLSDNERYNIKNMYNSELYLKLVQSK